MVIFYLIQRLTNVESNQKLVVEYYEDVVALAGVKFNNQHIQQMPHITLCEIGDIFSVL